MSYQAAQPQMQGQQHPVAHRASINRKPQGQAAPSVYQQATNPQATASPALSYSSTSSMWTPQSIGSSQSSPAQIAAIPSNMAQPTTQHAPASYLPACNFCGCDVSTDPNHLECLTCTSAGQSTLFCTSCCVTRGALGTHHHHMSKFVSISDALVHDPAMAAHGWDVRKSGIGVTWYQHRDTKIKTFERPNVSAPMMQANVAHLRTHSHIPVHTKTQGQSNHTIQSHQHAQPVSSNHSGQFGQPTQFIPSVQPVQPVQHVQQPQYVQAAQPVQPLQYAQQVQPLQTAQTVQPVQNIQNVQRVQQSQPSQPVQPVPQALPVHSRQPRQQVPQKKALSTKQQIQSMQQKISQPSTRAQPSAVVQQNAPAAASQPIQPSSIIELDLPPGWEEIKDPDGHVFYYYRPTKLSMWTAPVSPLPQGWKAFKNPDGRKYFSNPTLGLMQWTRPTAAAPVGNANRMSTGSGHATFMDNVNWSPKNSIQNMSPAQEYSPTSIRDGQNSQQNNSRRSSTLSTQSKTQSQLASLQEDEFSSLQRPISSGYGIGPSNRSAQPPPSMQQPPSAQQTPSLQRDPSMQHNPSVQQTSSMQHNPPMQQPPSGQPPPYMQQPPTGGVPGHTPGGTHSQGFTQQPVFGVSQQAQPQGTVHPHKTAQHQGPAQSQPLRLNNAPQYGGPQGPSPVGISAQAQKPHQQPGPTQNQHQVQTLRPNQTQGAARPPHPQNPGQPRPNQQQAFNQTQRPPQVQGMGATQQQQQQPSGPKKSSLTPQQKSALVNTGMKVGASLLRTAIRSSLTGDSGTDSVDFGGGDVSYDADFTDCGDSGLGDAGLGDTGLSDANLGDSSFTNTGLGSDQVFNDGGQSFLGQPDDSQFSLADQNTTQIDVNVDVNVDFGNTDGNGGFETVGDYSGISTDTQYGPVNGDISTLGDPEGVFFDNTQYGSGMDNGSGDVMAKGFVLNTADYSIGAEVQIETGQDSTYVGNVSMDQFSGNDLRDMNPVERAAPGDEGEVYDQGVTAVPDYEGAYYGPLSPPAETSGETTDPQDESNTKQGEMQAQGDQRTNNNIPDGKASEPVIWIDPNNMPIRPATTYNPLTSASLSGPLMDFYDGFELFDPNAPAELNSGFDLGDDEQYPDQPSMFPRLKRPPTQADALFPTSSNPQSLPQSTETGIVTAAAPDYEGEGYGPISATEFQDETSPSEPQQNFQPDRSGDPSQTLNGMIPFPQVQTMPQATPDTTPETTPQTTPETIPQTMQQIPSAQQTLPAQNPMFSFEPPLNIAPTTMNATN